MSDTLDATIDPRTAETVAGLRALADHLEAHPELRPYRGVSQTEVLFIENDPDRFAATASAMGGTRSKEASDELMTVTRDFGGHVVMRLIATRSNVCERRVVGVETVEVPDPDYIANAPTIVQTVEVVEWDCHPVLGGAA